MVLTNLWWECLLHDQVLYTLLQNHKAQGLDHGSYLVAKEKLQEAHKMTWKVRISTWGAQFYQIARRLSAIAPRACVVREKGSHPWSTVVKLSFMAMACNLGRTFQVVNNLHIWFTGGRHHTACPGMHEYSKVIRNKSGFVFGHQWLWLCLPFLKGQTPYLMECPGTNESKGLMNWRKAELFQEGHSQNVLHWVESSKYLFFKLINMMLSCTSISCELLLCLYLFILIWKKSDFIDRIYNLIFS